MEYYPGVLILTTNRVGEFDEAFRSRIHISLYYPKLDHASTSKIWDMNIARIKNSGVNIDIEEDEIRQFSEQHWIDTEDKPSRRWNGRQIKNAFQTALALANWDYHDDAKRGRALKRPLLRAKHFERVAKTSAHFDDYISDIHGIDLDDTYGVLAAREEVRKDTYPGTIAARSRTQDTSGRSKKPTIGRRAIGRRGKRPVQRNEEDDEEEILDDGSDVDDEDEVRKLELKLELAKLKSQRGTVARGKVPLPAKDEEDSELEEETW